MHTVRRLREICAIEGLKAETRALSTLVAVAKGDLRGCLNTLQVSSLNIIETPPTIPDCLVVHPVKRRRGYRGCRAEVNERDERGGQLHHISAQ